MKHTPYKRKTGKTVYSIKGLSNNHPVQKEFNTFMNELINKKEK